MVSIFKTFGEIITKHPWAFVALWIVALVVSLPLLGVFTSNLKYDTTGFIPKDLGAIAAQDKYDEQFPGNSSNHILVVIQSDNKTTAMHFMDDLDAAVLADANVTNVTGTSSIYNIQRDAVVNMTPDLFHSLYDAMDNTSDGNKKLYNATDEVRNSSNGLYWLWDNVTKTNDQFYKARKQIVDSSARLYSARDQIVAAHDGLYQIKGAADMILGVPMSFVQAYNGTDSSLDDANRSLVAYQAVKSSLSGPASNYLDAFYHAWTTGSGEPMTRAQNSIRSTDVSGFIGAMPESQRPMMLNIVNNFPLSNYPGGERDFCVNTVAGMQGITDSSLKQQLYAAYDLGASPSSTAIDNLVISMAASQGGVDKGSIEDIYYLGRNPSDGTIGNYVVNKAVESLRDSADGRNMSASDLQNATDMLHDAWNLGPSATEQNFDNYVLSKAEKGLNSTERQTVEEIWGWGRNPNDSVISSYVLREAGKDLNASENRTLAEIYALGRNASNDTIKNYVIGKALDELNLTSNTTYFMALLSLDRNLTDDQLKDFARSWEASHGYDDPKILPDSVVSGLAAGKVTLYIVTTSDLESSTGASDSVKAIQDHVAGLAKDERYSGVRAYVTGSTAISMDTKASAMDDVNNIDKVTIVLVLIILAIYFRSFLTPFIPLLITGIGVVVAFGFMGIVTTQIDVFYLVMTFMVVIMLGAGTDYCVFILSRYAEERSKGAEIKASVISSMENAGKSIASSGTTAMIGFSSLMLIDNGIFRSIGIGTASAVLFCMLVALTLVPAVLTIAGDRLFWPKKLYMSGPGKLGKAWRAITHKVLKHSKVIFAIALLITVPALYIYSNLQLGNDFVSMMPDSYASKMGYDLMNSEFGSGALEKGMVVATLPENLAGPDGNYSAAALGRVEALSSMLAATPGVDKVYSMTRPEGVTIEYDNLSAYKGAEKEYYQNYMDNSTGIDGRTTVIYVAFNGSPFSDQAQRSTDAMKQELKAYEAENPGTALLLGGSSVGSYEYQKMCTDKYILVIPVVLIGIFLVLLVLLRSVFTPARLIMTLLMSMFWTLAVFILVFQFWLHASVYWMLPIILFCVLMGLGVDYDIFLVTRIREEVYKGFSEEAAIENAIESSGTIITLCGLVMASAFGSMMLSSTIMLKEFGFVLCMAILLDATLMRLVIVPSIMVLLKKYNWWMPFVKDDEAKLAAVPEIQKPK
ncbi:MAG TPA: efflux RND transporter permease subunit [Methanocella sp.]|uniref:efflux RND transporter permease subunit n=1 Tax=Methanocella sp. TaxID=2052833 RepID=UPI002BF41161|nr:efflux RND transporter permease subunit [Methanocella sp.]HTY90556.1 efflux RND transporter permease subunit [Methanocella sp.]